MCIYYNMVYNITHTYIRPCTLKSAVVGTLATGISCLCGKKNLPIDKKWILPPDVAETPRLW